MRLDADRFQGTVADIFAGGMKIVADYPLMTGQAGQLPLAKTGTAPFDNVCRAERGRFGFRFVAPLPLGVLIRMSSG